MEASRSSDGLYTIAGKSPQPRAKAIQIESFQVEQLCNLFFCSGINCRVTGIMT